MMKCLRNPFINIASELIILLSSIITIAFMITDGCGGDGGNQNPPQPPVTGPPPECGSVNIDPECPAVSLPEFCSFWSYSCDFTEQNPETPAAEIFSIGIRSSACTSVDCFTLECEESFDQTLPVMSIITLDILIIDTG
jgi:hypothetical protein